MATCDSSTPYDPAEYNLPLHIGSVFIVLAVSGLACAFPMLVLRFPRLKIPAKALFATRHFGTGVLIATAFVHLLPEAFIALGDDCLSPFWTDDYPAMPGAIALGAVFLIATVEMVFSPEKSCCAMPVGVTRQTPIGLTEEGRMQSPDGEIRPVQDEPQQLPHGNEGEKVTAGAPVPSLRQTRSNAQQSYATADGGYDTEDEDIKFKLTPEQEHRKAFMQVVLLEMGILFHSVFIGMNLSVTSGSEFVILLIAICFHQGFEGLALGARIAALKWEPGAIKPWIMCLAYGCTTPIGQAIGLGLHTSYSPDSEPGLLIVGIMNAISAGLLIYASLVELLAEDFMSEKSWRVLRGMRRVFASSWLLLGAICMSLVGAWA